MNDKKITKNKERPAEKSGSQYSVEELLKMGKEKNTMDFAKSKEKNNK